MRIFAVDLGSDRAGWAYLDTEARAGRELLSAGLWRLQTARTESKGVRWLRFRRLLDEAVDISRLRIDLVAYEEVRNHGSSRMVSDRKTGRPRREVMFNVAAAHAYGAAEAELLAWCEGRRLEFASVTVAEIKSAATGKGGGKGTAKGDVLAAAARRWQRATFETDDVSDAAFIALAACRKFAPASPAAAATGRERPSKDPEQPTIF